MIGCQNYWTILLWDSVSATEIGAGVKSSLPVFLALRMRVQNNKSTWGRQREKRQSCNSVKLLPLPFTHWVALGKMKFVSLTTPKSWNNRAARVLLYKVPASLHALFQLTTFTCLQHPLPQCLTIKEQFTRTTARRLFLPSPVQSKRHATQRKRDEGGEGKACSGAS